MPLEIAVDNPADAIIAARYADRLELCSSLDRHGMTPSAGLVEEVSTRTGVPVFALVRECEPHHADRAMLGAMVGAATRVVSAGAAGIVIGVLTRGGEIDLPACRAIIDAAREIEPGIMIGFHRALDDAIGAAFGGQVDAARGMEAIESLKELGVSHALCAGAPGLDHSARSMADRLASLARARDLATPRVGIVACGGVRSSNAREFATASGGWVHSSCRVHGRFDESQARDLARLVR